MLPPVRVLGAEEKKKPHHVKDPCHWRERSRKSYLRIISSCNDFTQINSALSLALIGNSAHPGPVRAPLPTACFYPDARLQKLKA